MLRQFILAAAAVISLAAVAQRSNHTYVDLGLPSGTLWATCNVGATSPDEAGNYYQWADVAVFPDDDLAEKNCKSTGKKIDDFSGNPMYDAATRAWGAPWRTPTKEDCEELLDNCQWTFVPSEGNGYGGYEVEGPNGKTIFLPCAGSKYAMGIFDDRTSGCIMTSTPYGADLDSAFVIGFADPWDAETGEEAEDGSYDLGFQNRAVGVPVRPVRSK